MRVLEILTWYLTCSPPSRLGQAIDPCSSAEPLRWTGHVLRRNDHLLRTLVCGSLATVILPLAGSEAQEQGITVTFPARVVAAPDYATDVLGDAWDMCNAADVSPFPQELVGFSSSGFL